MAMRRKTAPTVKVKKTWRCPKCGHKIETAECYGCLIEEQRKKANIDIDGKRFTLTAGLAIRELRLGTLSTLAADGMPVQIA